VDPSIEILNQLAMQASKAEALISELNGILKDLECSQFPDTHNERLERPASADSKRRSQSAPDRSSQKTSRPSERERTESMKTRATSEKRTINAPKASSPRSTPPTMSYDRKELYKRVWTMPVLTVASLYGVSNFAIAKACKKLNIPVPGLGYWAKKAANRPVKPRPPLPKLFAN
jgi:transglutaminase/protease-like cytokinesis protein 3